MKVLEGVGRSDLEQTARRRSRETGPAARPAPKEAGSRKREPTNRNRIRGGVSQGKRTIDRELSRPRASDVIPGGCAGNTTILTGGKYRLILERGKDHTSVSPYPDQMRLCRNEPATSSTHRDGGSAAEAVEGALVELGPEAGAGVEREQADTRG